MRTLAVLIVIATASPAHAQDTPAINPNPLSITHDVNDVDLVTGVLRKSEPLVIGGDPGNPLTLSYDITSPGPPEGCCQLSTYKLGETISPDYYSWIKSPTGSSRFYLYVGYCNGTIWSAEGDVGSLTCYSGTHFYSDKNGNKLILNTAAPISAIEIFSTGEKWTYYSPQGILKFIVSNRGYGIEISSTSPRKFTYYNKAYVFCDEAAGVDCASVLALTPMSTISDQITSTSPFAETTTVTHADAGGIEINLTSYYGGTQVANYRRLNVSNSTRSYTYFNFAGAQGNAPNNFVSSVNDGTGTWTYEHTADDYEHQGSSGVTTSVMDPTGHQRSGFGDSGTGIIQLYRDELLREWHFDGNLAPTGYTTPDGNGVSYVGGPRGNRAETHISAKPGSGLPDIVMTANYTTTCPNLLTCNKPTWTRDAKGNQTDFTYDATHGGVLTQTGPADANGIRPQTRYTYVQRYAWILNSSGGYVHADGPIWLLDSESFCRASAATGNHSAPCIGNDEVKTSYEYGPDSGPNNLYLRGKAVTADGVTLRTCYGNDRNGRRISETSPRGTVGWASCP